MKLVLIVFILIFLSACGLQVGIHPEPIYVVEEHPYPVAMGGNGQFCRNVIGTPRCDGHLQCSHRANTGYFSWQTWQCVDLAALPPGLFDASYPPGSFVD